MSSYPTPCITEASAYLCSQRNGAVGVVAECDFHVLAVSEAEDGHVLEQGCVAMQGEGAVQCLGDKIKVDKWWVVCWPRCTLFFFSARRGLRSTVKPPKYMCQ